MARNEHGGTVWDVVVSPDLDDNGAVKVLPNTAVPWYDVDGVEQSDFLLWSPLDNDFTIAATEIVSNADGFVPRFLSPDGVQLYDGSGNLLPVRGGGGGGGVSSWDDLTDKPTTFTPATHSHSQSDVTGLATVLADKVDADDLPDEIEDYLSASSRPQIVVIGEDDAVPAVPAGTIVVRVSGSVSGGALSVSSVMATTATGGPTSWTTSGSPASLGAGITCLALVSYYQSGASSGDPAPLPADFDALGSGMTWSPVDLPADNTANGIVGAALFFGTGTGDATKPVVVLPESVTGVHIRIVQIVNAAGVLVQASSAVATGGNGSPSVSLPSPISGTGVVVSWIIQNNATNSQTPGTGFTEIGSATSSTGVRTSGEYQIPGAQAATWTKATSPNQYQALVVAAEVR